MYAVPVSAKIPLAKLAAAPQCFQDLLPEAAEVDEEDLFSPPVQYVGERYEPAKKSASTVKAEPQERERRPSTPSYEPSEPDKTDRVLLDYDDAETEELLRETEEERLEAASPV